MEDTVKTRTKRAQNKLKKLLKTNNFSDESIKMMLPIIQNVSWMQIKLEDIREQACEQNIIIEYNNGGGQSGYRENPLFKSYENLWKSYILGMNKILECLPEEVANEQKEELKHKNMLDIIKERRQSQA